MRLTMAVLALAVSTSAYGGGATGHWHDTKEHHASTAPTLDSSSKFGRKGLWVLGWGLGMSPGLCEFMDITLGDVEIEFFESRRGYKYVGDRKSSDGKFQSRQYAIQNGPMMELFVTGTECNVIRSKILKISAH